MTLSLAVVLLLTSKWIRLRVDEELAYRLNRAAEVLQHIHTSASAERLNKFRSISVEPRFRALVQAGDKQTLRFAAKEIRQELECVLFAFLSTSGQILAWEGDGKALIEQKIPILLRTQKDIVTDVVLIDKKVMELAIVPIQIQDKIKGHILGATVLDKDILHDYYLAIDADIELQADNRVIIRSHGERPHSEFAQSRRVPLKGSINFVVHLDAGSVAEPLQDVLRALILICISAILIGGVVALFIASQFSRPIQALTGLTKTVSGGNYGERVEEKGAPELRNLARNFNWMLNSLVHYQDELKKHADNLDELVKERTQRLDKEIEEHKETMRMLRHTNSIVEAASQVKGEFLANVSHELRTPLHGILSFANFGINKNETATPEKRKYYFSMIKQSGNTLLHLLNDLLDLAKMEAGKMTFNFRVGDLQKLIDNVADEFSSVISERATRINYLKRDDKVVLRHDPERIKQVLRNLISNAVKFSPVGGEIEINLTQDDDSVIVSVKDQGVGIPEEELDAVFDKFIQSSKTKTGAGGTGLGLAICKEIVHCP